MNYRKLGRADVEVSEISFGCWTMGGLNWVNGTPNGWANPDEEEIVAGVKVGPRRGGESLRQRRRLWQRPGRAHAGARA